MGLVDDQQEVVREEVQQGMGRGTGFAPVEVAGIVLHSGAGADLGEHLQVVGGAHGQPLGLQLLALLAQLAHTPVQLLLDGLQGALHPFGTGHIVGGGEDVHGGLMGDLVPGQRVQCGDAVDLVPEEFDADGQLLIDGDDLDRVAAHAEGASGEGDVVALVLHVHELAQQVVPVDPVTLVQEEHAPGVLLGRAQAVDAGDGGHHHTVAPGQQVGRGGVPEPLHVVVDVRVLLDIGIRLRDVGLGLVVVVVGDEVGDRIVGHELAELGAELGGQGLVGLQNQSGPLQALDQPGRGRGLAGAGGAHEHHVVLAVLDPRGQLLDGLRLVAGGLVGRLDHEGLVGPLNVEPHETPFQDASFAKAPQSLCEDPWAKDFSSSYILSTDSNICSIGWDPSTSRSAWARRELLLAWEPMRSTAWLGVICR